MDVAETHDRKRNIKNMMDERWKMNTIIGGKQKERIGQMEGEVEMDGGRGRKRRMGGIHGGRVGGSAEGRKGGMEEGEAGWEVE